MIFFYRVAFIPFFLVLMPYYFLRMIRRGGYAKDFQMRFGKHKILPKNDSKKRVWIQAVSVGELEAISPLVDSLISKNAEIIITTTTSTGYKILQDKFAKKCLYCGIFPIDFYFFSKKTWNALQPDIAILMEGELWPEHLAQAKKHNAKTFLINARMSDKSFSRYMKLKFFAKKLFKKLDLIICSNEISAEHFLKCGADKEKVKISGNIKFDSEPEKALTQNEIFALKKEFGFNENSLVLLGSSTWEGEEEMLVEALEKIRVKNIDCRLLLIPRHAERRNQIKDFLKTSCFSDSFNLRSENKIAENCLVYMADTTGELRTLGQTADFAFIGKSLNPNVGGQTPIDCAYSKTAILCGKNMNNFKAICKMLKDSNAALFANNKDEAIVLLEKLACDERLRKILATNAKNCHSKNRGATQRTVDFINPYLLN